MIVLVTDFGLAGPYVGQMKAVLYREAPGVPVVDLFHDAPAFDPMFAAYLLSGMIPGLADLSPAIRVAASLLAGAILVARSPSSAIAVVKELRAHGPFTKTVLGVTVIMDVVVIIAFAGAAAVAGALVSNEAFDLGFLGVELLKQPGVVRASAVDPVHVLANPVLVAGDLDKPLLVFANRPFGFRDLGVAFHYCLENFLHFLRDRQ